MRLIERLAGGRKAASSEGPGWSLESLRDAFHGGRIWNGEEKLPHNFEAYAQRVYRENGPVFSLVLVRQLLFSEARFQWRELVDGRPGRMSGGGELDVLHAPWLMPRMELDVSLAGNNFTTTVDSASRYGRRASGSGLRAVRMRPDWVTIVSGSRREDGSPDSLDAEVLAFWYRPPGRPKDEVLLEAADVAHWAPIPDPLARWRGMSWLTPVLREVEGDKAATVHKGRFFLNAARPSLSVSMDKAIKPTDFARFVAMFNEQFKGAENAYKTLFLGGGADVKPLTMDMKQLDFRATQGAGETRLAAAAGVPPIIAGFSEGLQSATYSNYGQARRRFADGTMRPLWRTAAAALETLVTPPANSKLWYDDRDISFLAEDQHDAAEIQRERASTIRQLTDSGWEPASVVAAVEADDFTLLRHSGLYSVQLQKPGTPTPGAPAVPPEEQ